MLLEPAAGSLAVSVGQIPMVRGVCRMHLSIMGPDPHSGGVTGPLRRIMGREKATVLGLPSSAPEAG